MLSPTVLMLSPTYCCHPPHVLKVSPNVLNTLHSTKAIPHCTDVVPTLLSNLPSTDAISHSTEAMNPQYWYYPLDVLNNLQCTEPTSYGVFKNIRLSGILGLSFKVSKILQLLKLFSLVTITTIQSPSAFCQLLKNVTNSEKSVLNKFFTFPQL